MFETIDRLRDAAEENMRQFPERVVCDYPILCEHMFAAWPSCMALLAANPDDIRALGWVVAVHNDYKLDGMPHTFWLFTKGDRALKGEGKNDVEALNAVRAQIREHHAAGADMTRPMMQHAEFGSMRPAASVLRDLLECPRDYLPKTQIAAAANIIDEQAEQILTLRCNLACATCLWRSTQDDPCPYLKQCCYSTKKGIGEKDNNFWSGVDSSLP